nr:xylulose kinase-1 [Tanacetum cinerariifolium]
MTALLNKDDHNKVAYLEKGKGWEAYEQILDFLNRSHIWYALTHRPPIVFDSLVKQFWATATVRTLEAGPSEIIATIDGNEVVVTESLIRTQLQLNDANGLIYNFSRFILDGMIGNIGSKRHKFLMYPRFLQMILGIQTTDPSPRPTLYFTAKLFSNMKLNWDGPHMPLLAPMLVGPAGGDGADAVAAGPSTATQDTPVRDPTPVREPTPSPVKEPTPFQEPTPDSPRPPSPLYPRSEESNDAPPTTAATAAGGAEDSAALTDLSFKLDSKRKRRLVLSDSEGEDAATKEQDIDLDALHKLASTSLGGDTTVEAAYTIYKASQTAHASSDPGHDEDEVPDDATMPFRRTRTKRRRLRKTVTSSAFKHFQENISAVEDTIPAGDGIPADAQTIPAGSTPIPSSGGVSAGSSMDHAGQATVVAPSSTIPAADKGKAPMVDDFLHVDLLTEQECILKNLHDYQLGEDLAKKLHAEQKAEFARQQEELAQKAQAESVASPAEQGTGLSAQRRRELDLLGDDVNEDNINERLGMLLMRKRRELAEQSHVKALSIAQLKHEFEYIQRTLERSNLLNFKRTSFRPTPTLEAPSAKRARQGVPQDVPAASLQVFASVSAAPSTAAAVSVPAAPSIPADVSIFVALYVHADTEVDAAESRMDDTQTASEHVSTEHTVDESTPSSSRNRRKHISKKRVTPIVDVADDALIKFDSASESDDDPLPYAPYVGWEMVSTPLGSIHAYYDMEEHTKHFTSLCELLHMVEKNDLRKLLGAVDNLYQREKPDTFALILWGDLRVLFQSLVDEDTHAFWRNQDSWRIRSWRLYPRAQVHVLETVDGRVIYMFVDVSYPLSEATLKRMLQHGLEVL